MQLEVGLQTRPASLRAQARSRRCRQAMVQAQHSLSVNRTDYWQAAVTLHDQLEGKAAYMLIGQAAAVIQGVAIPEQQLGPIQLTLQWDFLEDFRQQLLNQQVAVSEILHSPGRQWVQLELQGVHAVVSCELNTVVAMNPNRLYVKHKGRHLWCEGLLSVRSSAGSTHAASGLAAQVSARLQELQTELTAANSKVWAQAGDAWNVRLGSPQEAAAWLKQDPLLRLGWPLAKHLPLQLAGCRLINLMGSHGSKAVAAALLGATVTCVDVSAANIEYGCQVAAAAGVADRVMFLQADVLQLPADQLTGSYDVVLLELGVLHYFVDLQPLMDVIMQLLRPGGRLVLREFHPVSTKLISSKGKKHKVTGNYFSQELRETPVSYSKYNTATEPQAATATATSAGSSTGVGSTVRLRQWGLGEVVSAAAVAGLIVQQLEEDPGVKLADFGLPKLFTLVASKL